MKEWPTYLLGEVADVFNGKTPAKTEQRTSGHPVLKIRDVDEDGKFRGRHESFVDPAFAAANDKKKILVCDVLILNAAHNADYVASKVFFAGDAVRGALATGEWTIIRAKPAALNPGFVHYWVRSQVGRTLIKNLVRGIHLYPSDVASIRFPVPPLTEQERIVKLLDATDELRKLRTQADHRTADLIPALFDEMFERRAHEFKLVKIEDVAAKSRYSLSSGPFGSNLTAAHYTSNGIIVLRGLNVSGGKLNLENVKYISEQKANELARSATKPGDVVVVAVGSSGKAFQIPDNLPIAIMSQNFNKITPDISLIEPTFLEHCINTPRVQRQFYQEITDTVRTFLSLTKLKNVKIALPPRPLQKEFARRVTEITELAAVQATSRQHLDDLFQSMVHGAFNGEL
jgi:type I restriction enzyme S subunit